MSTPTPLQLATDAELLNELTARARSGSRRAFVGMFVRPNEDRGDTSSGWAVLSAGDGSSLREVLLFALSKFYLGAPHDYAWLWDRLLPYFDISVDDEGRTVVDLLTNRHGRAQLHGWLLGSAMRPVVPATAAVLALFDQLAPDATRRPDGDGWYYEDQAGNMLFRLEPGTAYYITDPST